MDREAIRRKALLAAGSVVLAATLTACPHPSIELADTAARDADSAADTDPGETADGRPDCSAIDMADTEAYAACCDALAGWCGEAYGADSEEATECIYGPDYDGSTGCIPWGPPVPPRFRSAAFA